MRISDAQNDARLHKEQAAKESRDERFSAEMHRARQERSATTKPPHAKRAASVGVVKHNPAALPVKGAPSGKAFRPTLLLEEDPIEPTEAKASFGEGLTDVPVKAKAPGQPAQPRAELIAQMPGDFLEVLLKQPVAVEHTDTSVAEPQIETAADYPALVSADEPCETFTSEGPELVQSSTEAVLAILERACNEDTSDQPSDQPQDQQEHDVPEQPRVHFDAPTLQLLAGETKTESISAPAWMKPVFDKIEVWRDAQNSTVAQLKLPTDDLGEVHCTLRLSGGEVRIELRVPTLTAAATLQAETQRATPALVARLAKYGLNLQALAVKRRRFA